MNGGLKRHLVDRGDDHVVPWLLPETTYSLPGIVGLHEEVEACYSWLRSTPAEDYVREYSVRELERLTRKLWPKCVMEVIGSFSTGFCLPSSDIDVVLFGGWTTPPLHTLADHLKDCGFADADRTVIVDSARVPVVKIVHKMSRTKFDISFNQVDGIRTSELLARYARDYPNFPKIYLIVKQMLVRRDLNECFAGGVSSFSLALLVVFFFQRLEVEKVPPRTNLGVLLLEFLEYYGTNFDFTHQGIDVKEKKIISKRFGDGRLLISNPFKGNEQVAVSTKLISEIAESFCAAYATLNACVVPTTVSATDDLCSEKRLRGFLGKVVGVDEAALEYRKLAQEFYDHRVFGQISEDFFRRSTSI